MQNHLLFTMKIMKDLLIARMLQGHPVVLIILYYVYCDSCPDYLSTTILYIFEPSYTHLLHPLTIVNLSSVASFTLIILSKKKSYEA